MKPTAIEREAPFVPIQMEYSPSVSRPENLVVHGIQPEPVKAKREKAEPETNGLMTAEEAAQYVGVHIETLRKWVRLGTFPRIPLPGGGKDFRFSKAMINRWAEERAFVPK